MADLVLVLDLLGVAVFAASGALTASRQQLDIVGFLLVGTVTGIGGGTLRDLLLGVAPVFWVEAPVYVLVTFAVAALVFFTAHLIESRFRALLWADAAGLALFAALGAEKALDHGAPAAVALLMGVMTATFGGLVRDVLCNEVPLILRREIYATAAALGAGSLVLLDLAGAPRAPVLILACLVGFSARGLAIVTGFSLPPYKPRPARHYASATAPPSEAPPPRP
jgi:uncharacterized membrane protein YeiH